MGNFASSALCRSIDSQTKISDYNTQKVSADFSTTRRMFDSLKNAVFALYDDIVTSLSGSSVVISEVEELWYQERLGEVGAMQPSIMRIRHQCAADVASTDLFLGPSDTTVISLDALQLAMYSTKPWTKLASNEDDDSASHTTDETDDESKCDYSDDSDVSECEGSEFGFDDEEHDTTSGCYSCTQRGEIEYYKEDDDTETKADRLLRLASIGSEGAVAPVYVEDYLCPCGECPQYDRIACDVEATVTWRGVKDQGSITRVLQAFSTYNEVIGYHPDMIEAAEECLQLWLGDEDRALQSFVMLYDEVPQLCDGQL